MQVIHHPRPEGEKFEYVYYLTDESFDYPTGYGYDTCCNTMQHGFSIYIDDLTPNLESIEPLGHFDTYELKNASKTPSEFIKWLEKSKNEINIGDFDGNLTEDILDELISFVSKLTDKAA